jgi:transcription-repair coupling factor (superfamily II helicase)
MALSKIKDISVIATPPSNRKPVKNIINGFDWKYVKEAVENEIKRGGQVYYLHNRIENIEQIAAQIQGMFPDENIEIAHARMSSKALERVMRDFAWNQIRVLVCTTIIENGLDFPNVNSLIIDDPEKLGLSQMYQIRGRIGRGDKQAFAYFLYKTLRGDSKLRLDAMSEFEELGSGFLLSNRDLEIRGAGNILGDEQSGSINSVGYGLYMKMLGEAIDELRKSSNQEFVTVKHDFEIMERLWLK